MNYEVLGKLYDKDDICIYYNELEKLKVVGNIVIWIGINGSYFRGNIRWNRIKDVIFGKFYYLKGKNLKERGNII